MPQIWRNFPTCTFNSYCKFIWHPRVVKGGWHVVKSRKSRKWYLYIYTPPACHRRAGLSTELWTCFSSHVLLSLVGLRDWLSGTLVGWSSALSVCIYEDHVQYRAKAALSSSFTTNYKRFYYRGRRYSNTSLRSLSSEQGCVFMKFCLVKLTNFIKKIQILPANIEKLVHI